MARVYFALLCAALFVACNNAYVVDQDSELTVQIVEDISKFRSEFPNVKLVPLQRAAGDSLQGIRYTLGTRISSDRLVAQGNNNYQYPSPQDVQLQLQYPQNGGSGAVLTYIEINVAQSAGAVGNAYVVSGGIGQRSIRLVVEARRTTAFSYRAALYGY